MTELLAIERRAGRSPTLVFLPGYASDMTGSKALALDAWAAERGQASVRFDYRGCGASPGRFEDFTLEDWRDDALSVVDAVEGPVVLIGSSMGGWLMLLVALARPAKVVGLVGIAAAPDFTKWGFTDEQKARLAAEGRIEEPSEYGAPLVTTHAFWLSGQRNLLLHAPINVSGQVRLLQGQRDPDVPWQTALDLADRLHSPQVQVTLLKDGDHRLSRPQDLALLIATVEQLLEAR